AMRAPRLGPGGRFLTRPGLFSWDRVDPGSRLLAETLPADLAGRVADLGSGWGWLADAVLRRCPGVRALDLYEADRCALDLARRNLDGARADAALAYRWHDVAAGLPAGIYDAIVTNPPFHEGRAARPELGQAFIAAAAEGLRRRGRLWLVANRNLPYERTLAAHLVDTAVVAERDGFKVLTGRRK
ncbi:MAG: methyltransferase, partial [Alphaproteobacteria bacterium]|nr:methyltransferase [Alphaproteobacteria bacterium]